MLNPGDVINSSSQSIDKSEVYWLVSLTHSISQLDTERISNPNLLKAHIYMQRFYLQKWLHRQDRTGMSHLIEIRVPYCDLKLIGNYINLRYNTLHEITGKKSDLKSSSIVHSFSFFSQLFTMYFITFSSKATPLRLFIRFGLLL